MVAEGMMLVMGGRGMDGWVEYCRVHVTTGVFLLLQPPQTCTIATSMMSATYCEDVKMLTIGWWTLAINSAEQAQ